MNLEEKNSFLIQVINHIKDINELLIYNNVQLNLEELKHYYYLLNINLKSKNANEFLASLILKVFDGSQDKIEIEHDNVNSLLIINYVNTILSDMKFRELQFEVI